MAKRKNGTSSLALEGTGLGFFEEFLIKQIEAKMRLAKVFAAFVRLPIGGYFVCGGNVPPTHFSNSNFGCVVIGHSLVEIEQGTDLLRKIGSRTSSLFTEKDFYSTVATDFVSGYLRANIQSMRTPQALAVEFIIVDSRGSLLRVHFTGDMEIDDLGATDEEVFVVGGYDEKFKKNLVVELKKSPKKVNSEEMTRFAKRLSHKFKVPHLGFIF